MRLVRKTGLIGALVAVTVVAAATGALAGTGGQPSNGNAPNAVGKWLTFGGNRTMLVSGISQQPPNTQQCQQEFGISCYWPFQLQQAYNLNTLYQNGLNGAGETIAIIDSYGSPTIQSDLATFDTQFGLPAPPSFQIIAPDGPIPPYDPSNSTMVGWAEETSLDVQWAHSIAPGANILLVETPTAETEGVQGFPMIMAAENYVIQNHLANVITQSFAATEQTFKGTHAIEKLRRTYVMAKRNHITVLGSSGDAGASSDTRGGSYFPFPVTNWPASDPLVTAVGGTQLHLDANGNRTAPDNVWNDTYNPNVVGPTPSPAASGGGLSIFFSRPAFQNGVSGVVGNQRGVPDISMSAAVDGGVIVYFSFGGVTPGWYIIGGTSEASPEFSGVVSIADQAAGHSLGYLNPMLYKLAANHAPGIVDITSGNNTVSFTNNGTQYTVNGWNATTGYEPACGLGTVNAGLLVPELAAMANGKQ